MSCCLFTYAIPLPGYKLDFTKAKKKKKNEMSNYKV